MKIYRYILCLLVVVSLSLSGCSLLPCLLNDGKVTEPYSTKGPDAIIYVPVETTKGKTDG